MKFDAAELLSIKDSYRPDTKRFVMWLRRRGREMTVEALQEYADEMRETGYAVQTINKRITGAKRVLRRVFLQSEESHDTLATFEFENAIREVKKMHLNTREVPEHKLLSAEEVRTLVESERVPKRVRLIIRAFSLSGLRVSELINIRLSDMREDSGRWSVRILGKGRKERRIALPGDLVLQVREVFRGSTYLFESTGGERYDRKYISQVIGWAGWQILGKRISAHTLRHTFATHLITTGKTVTAVSRYLGHATTAITQDMYVHDRLSLDDIIESM